MKEFFANLTTGQKLAIFIGILSAIAGGTAQLTPIFGVGATHLVVSIANATMTIVVTPILFVVTGQSGQLKAVQAMPGIDKITVNAGANPTLAQMAVDDANLKIEATPQADAAVKETAKNG